MKGRCIISSATFSFPSISFAHARRQLGVSIEPQFSQYGGTSPLAIACSRRACMFIACFVRLPLFFAVSQGINFTSTGREGTIGSLAGMARISG
jgi:hypothetical protein